MRRLLLVLWCLVPVCAFAFHMGPGQDHMLLDDAGELIARAEIHATRAGELREEQGDEAARDEFALAEELFEKALGLLPDDRIDENRRLRLERAKCQMMISELPAANGDLRSLVKELATDEAADPELLADARRSFANSEYYMTWLMRLEGAPREDWEPRIEAARQSYKLLARNAEAAGLDEQTTALREDLESAVRLARMDLTELQGLPLPSQ